MNHTGMNNVQSVSIQPPKPGSLERMVRRITDKWEELEDNCEYRNLPRERMEAMLTIELSTMCAEYEAAYKRLHSQVSGYLHGEEWEHWQRYNEPRYAPNAGTELPARVTTEAHNNQKI